MTTVEGAIMLSQQQYFSVIDYNKCNRMIESLEKYSSVLDSIIQQTPKIEKTELKEK